MDGGIPGVEFLSGAVDLYVHSSPDLIPRIEDDLALAARLRSAGYRAAVHRHHFSGTAERSALASAATGFDLRGALLLDASAGGINPAVVEVALRMGAVWVGLPTLSSAAFRASLPARPPQLRALLGIGDTVHVVGPDGSMRGEVCEVLRLIAASGAVLATGYLAPPELDSVLRKAREAGVERVVLSNPLSPAMGMTARDVVDLLKQHPEAVLEESVYQHLPGLPVAEPALSLADCAPVFRDVGLRRVVLSSDGGIVGAPPPELLAAGCASLIEAGLRPAEVRRLVQDNPAQLLGI